MRSSLKLLFFLIKLLFLTPTIGILIFFLISIFGNISISIFFGITIAYCYLAMDIIMHTSGKKIRNFLCFNAYLCSLIIVAAILLFFLLPTKTIGVLMFGFGLQMFIILFKIGTNSSKLDKPENQIEPAL